MIYLPISLLEPGMVLARNVPSSNPILPLMVAGQPLTDNSIKRVTIRGIKGLYIEYENSDDITNEEILEPEQKQTILVEIKSEFDKVSDRGARPSYKAISKMAESIVMNMLEKDVLLCNVIDIRDHDNYTYSHSLYVGMISTALGAHMNLPASKLIDLAVGGLLHDIGKLEIPTDIINKPGPLTEVEYELMREHPARALPRIRQMGGCKERIIQGVATHHENYDGTGYPMGKKKEEIPLYGRILAVADVYDALSSNRAYRRAWTPAKVVDYITSRSGTQFDPDVLTSFLHSIVVYPMGTVVRLSDGSIGIVIKNHPELILRPTVRILAPKDIRNVEIDLSREAFHITVIDILDEPTNEVKFKK